MKLVIFQSPYNPFGVISVYRLGSYRIDYAILTIENYAQIRKRESSKKKAAIEMVEMSFPSMLTSGGILIACGYIVYMVSTSPAICEVGHLIGRGAILSVFFVTTLMPAVLQFIDPFIVMDRKQRRELRKQKKLKAKTHDEHEKHEK